ncbi:ornithine cyclodeaminase family protein [Maritalea sp.]|uniref:ornithine cyclodeaminase family protein n=1 Tax=Maritalea sp. TaxID=2003361 RepID=UPI003EF0EB96
MHLLNQEQIAEHCKFFALADAIRDSYIAVSKGEATIPPVGYLPIKNQNADCHIKFGHLHADKIFLVKIATGFYDNPSKGLPSSNGMMVAFSAQTGEVVAVLQDEGYLTDQRTAIGAAIATKALANADAHKVLVIGAGIQAEQQIIAHHKILKGRDLEFTLWARDVQKAADLCAKLKAQDILVTPTQNLEQACGDAQVILTTTPSRAVLVESDWVKAGTHITATGADAPGKYELDPKLVARADILVADQITQCLDHGEFSNAHSKGLIKETDCIELGNVLAEPNLGRRSAEQISIVDLTGLASQDIAAARTVLEAAGII